MLKTLPRKTLLSLSLAAAVLGLSATAIAQGSSSPEAVPAQATSAQTAGAPGAPRLARMMRHQGDRHERMQALRADRLEQLKADLKLTPEQEPAWLAFVARTEPPATPPGFGERAGRAGMNTLERLEQMEARQAAHAEAMKVRIDAVRSFYGTLDDAQKQVFDTQAMGGMMRTAMRGEFRMDRHGAHGEPGQQMHRHDHGNEGREGMGHGRMAPEGKGPDGMGCPAEG